MDKNTILTMPPSIRVQEVNKLLEDHSLSEICELYGISSGSFSKLMREGDYLYHQADKRYYPFVRSEEERVKNPKSGDSDEIAFFKQNVDTLKKIVSQFEEQGLLLLDNRIYSREAKFVNKSIRMNNDIYEEFSSFCEEYYPHLKTQDVIAQTLIDAMDRYRPECKREQ
ncbi:hypothetical protein [Priestia flexa]|uniref:hypothetical protein n=1 Tax=Priestia flexa TaxID=86664 RepID=UPI002492AF13|nr:hypothetical protein [Priestia flexa]